MRKLGSLLATTLAIGLTSGGVVAVAPGARAATPADHIDLGRYSIDGGLGSYETACAERNEIGTPWTYTGTSDAVHASQSASFDAVQTSTGRVIASFAASGYLSSTLSHGTGGSLAGRIRFNGSVGVQAKVGGVCSGYGVTSAHYDKVLRATRDGVFSLTGAAPARQLLHTSLAVQVFDADSAGLPVGQGTTVYDVAESGSDANGRPRPLAFATTFAVKAGQYIEIGGSTDIGARTSWSSTQVAGGPVVYTPRGYDGGGEITWNYRLGPARGEQLAPTPGKVAHLVTLPTRLDCRHHRFVFKPKKAHSIRKVTVSANGRRLRTIQPVHRREKVKVKAATRTITLAFVYKSGKKRTITKKYAACR